MRHLQQSRRRPALLGLQAFWSYPHRVNDGSTSGVRETSQAGDDCGIRTKKTAGGEPDCSLGVLLNPIVLFQGKILDGRDRARACKVAGLDLATRWNHGNTETFQVMLTSFSCSEDSARSVSPSTSTTAEAKKPRSPNDPAARLIGVAASPLCVSALPLTLKLSNQLGDLVQRRLVTRDFFGISGCMVHFSDNTNLIESVQPYKKTGVRTVGDLCPISDADHRALRRRPRILSSVHHSCVSLWESSVSSYVGVVSRKLCTFQKGFTPVSV